MASNIHKVDEERAINFNSPNTNNRNVNDANMTKDYFDPLPVALIDWKEFGSWSFYRAIITEFVATLLFLYIAINTVIGAVSSSKGGKTCGGVGILGISWAFGGMIFVLVYCTAGISGTLIQSLQFLTHYH